MISFETLHLYLARLTLGLLLLSAIQALCVLLHERKIKRSPESACPFLPSLERMEKILFFLSEWGFVALTLLLSTAFYSLSAAEWHFWKILFSCVLWALYAFVLVGHRFRGWRGPKVAYSLLWGGAILSAIYALASIFEA